MAQWTDLQQIEKFVNRKQLYATYEKSGGLLLAEPGLTAGWLAGWLADEIWARLEILKACCRSKYSIFRFVYLAKVLHCFSNFDAFITLFQGNISTRLFYKV